MNQQAPSKANLFLSYGLVFLGTFLILQLFQGPAQQENPILDSGDIGIEVMKERYAIGKEIRVEVQNNMEDPITFAWTANDALAINVYEFSSEGFEQINQLNGDLEGCDQDNCQIVKIEPGERSRLSLGNYAYSYFGEVGRYKVGIEYGDKEYQSPEFEIKNPSFITRTWRTLLYQPILNALVWLITLMPNHSLGWAVIILTLFIRTLLLVPSAKGLKAQRRMQEMQPKIEALKKKYEHDQARLAQETMLLWKKHKVSPFSSCLPLLIQFPVLIALYYVIRNGLSPDHAGFLYGFQNDFSLAEIDPFFAGLDLLKRNLIALPLIIGALQFGQMQLITYKTKKNTKKDDKKKETASEVETANKMMKYIMPLMIAFFTSQLPAAVGLYWGTSTFYGILQQLVINRKPTDTTDVKSEDDVKVRVINKKAKN